MPQALPQSLPQSFVVAAEGGGGVSVAAGEGVATIAVAKGRDVVAIAVAVSKRGGGPSSCVSCTIHLAEQDAENGEVKWEMAGEG